MENIKVTLVQPDIIWENAQANLMKYNALLSEVSTDVIILPEMFTTGFSMSPEKLKERMDGISVEWMKNMAYKKNASVVGSLIIEEKGKVYNRAVWVFPDGNLQSYDKRHLFSMGDEHYHFSEGSKKLVVEFRGWKFCPLICYDLRFPVWSRNTENYDVLIYLANWPSIRQLVWKNLLVARAIENQSYCFGVNRTGTDGTGINYSGGSAFISPKGDGEFLSEAERIQTFELSFSEMHNFRKSFPVLDDRDTFLIV